jgi:hypothetical protein
VVSTCPRYGGDKPPDVQNAGHQVESTLTSEVIMSTAQPFGQLDSAAILVIGHDPRLQRSQTEAEYAFFMAYLTRPRPVQRSEQRKYDLAQAVVDYVSELAGRPVALDELYVTNLCNEFLPHTPGSGTVFIPDEQARRGVEEITGTVAAGHFQLILPMSQQTFYNLCRLGFVDDRSELVAPFIREARPNQAKTEQGLYASVGRAPFLAVCGQRFHHCGIPVVPVLHVKQWPRLPTLPSLARYRLLMVNAEKEVRAILGQP